MNQNQSNIQLEERKDNSQRIAIRDMDMKQYIKPGLPTRGQANDYRIYIRQ